MGATHLVDSIVACAAEGLAVEDLVAGCLQSTTYGLVAPERIRFSRAAGDFDTSALQSLLVCEMHRGERDAIFTSPLSSEPKCLSFIALLLEARFYHAQDRRRCKSTVRRVMHHPVGVSLSVLYYGIHSAECVHISSMPAESMSYHVMQGFASELYVLSK